MGGRLEVITLPQCLRLCSRVLVLKRGSEPCPWPCTSLLAERALPGDHILGGRYNGRGETQLSCVLHIILCPPGMQAWFSLISPPLFYPVQLATWKIPGMLMLVCGPELALTKNKKAPQPRVVQKAGPLPGRQQNKYQGPGDQGLARSLETCQAQALCPPGSAF